MSRSRWNSAALTLLAFLATGCAVTARPWTMRWPQRPMDALARYA